MRSSIILVAGAAAQAVAAAAQVAPADPPPPAVVVRIVPAPAPRSLPTAAGVQPLVCRSSIETGSLIARHRQCLTKSQWRYVDDAHETEARRLMQDNMNKPGCNGPNC